MYRHQKDQIYCNIVDHLLILQVLLQIARSHVPVGFGMCRICLQWCRSNPENMCVVPRKAFTSIQLPPDKMTQTIQIASASALEDADEMCVCRVCIVYIRSNPVVPMDDMTGGPCRQGALYVPVSTIHKTQGFHRTRLKRCRTLAYE